jgi:hypothetical protein
MKKAFALVVLCVLFSGTAGCRIGECWREAWQSRFCPQQQRTVIVAEPPCVMSDSCASPCGTCAPCNAVPVGR